MSLAALGAKRALAKTFSAKDTDVKVAIKYIGDKQSGVVTVIPGTSIAFKDGDFGAETADVLVDSGATPGAVTWADITDTYANMKAEIEKSWKWRVVLQGVESSQPCDDDMLDPVTVLDQAKVDGGCLVLGDSSRGANNDGTFGLRIGNTDVDGGLARGRVIVVDELLIDVTAVGDGNITVYSVNPITNIYTQIYQVAYTSGALSTLDSGEFGEDGLRGLDNEDIVVVADSGAAITVIDAFTAHVTEELIGSGSTMEVFKVSDF